MCQIEYKVKITDTIEEWFNLQGLRHRLDGPAIITDIRKEWFVNGKRHRSNGPAVITSNYVEFWLNGDFICDLNTNSYELFMTNFLTNYIEFSGQKLIFKQL